MKKETVKKLKVFTLGIAMGACVLTGINHYNNKVIERKNKIEDFTDKFGTPSTSSSVDTTETVIEKKYSFEYYGKQIDIQNENLEVWGFDENGKPYKLDLEEVEVEKKKDNIINKDYLSELEYKVYNSIQNKDSITSQYNVYLLFCDITNLCEELINRENFDGKQERINYLYNVCISYMYPESKYTFGGFKFDELNNIIKKDIQEEALKIKYMNDNNSIKEEEFMNEWKDNFEKMLNYGLFGVGQ